MDAADSKQQREIEQRQRDDENPEFYGASAVSVVDQPVFKSGIGKYIKPVCVGGHSHDIGIGTVAMGH